MDADPQTKSRQRDGVGREGGERTKGEEESGGKWKQLRNWALSLGGHPIMVIKK